MADYNLNYIPTFSEESIVYYIGGNKLQMCYALTCTIQAREEYKGQLHECHVAIMSSLGEHMPHQ